MTTMTTMTTGRGGRRTASLRWAAVGLAWAMALASWVGAPPDAVAATSPRMTCAQTATQAMVEGVYGPVKKFTAKDTGCRWSFKGSKGGFLSGNTNGFAGGAKAYEQMVRGAKSSMKKYGALTEGKTVGRRSFEFQGKPFGMPGVQVGFLSSNGKYAVTVTVGGTAVPSLDAARKLAQAIDAHLSGGKPAGGSKATPPGKKTRK